jgi:fermentation-respiration switch protein FrsA (DUF1100 family)
MNWIRRSLVAATVIGAFGYFGILSVLMLFENQMVFPAPRYPVGDWDQDRIAVEDVAFTSSDGTRLHGWFVSHPRPRAIVLYFHGNGENVGQQADVMAWLHESFDLSVFVFDYRGYGKSSGKPNENGIRADAQAALGWLNRRTGTRPDQIVFFGRSLGAAVAVGLAEQKGCLALVLQSAFSSLPDVAAQHYPWFPVRWMLRNRFPAASWIQRCPQPLLQWHGAGDSIVPITCARKLFEASPSTHKQWVVSPESDHNDNPDSEFWRSFDAFLELVARN